MSTNVHKNSQSMHPVYTSEFLSRLRDGIKIVFDAARESGAPSSFTLPLADAMSCLDSAITICRLNIKG